MFQRTLDFRTSPFVLAAYVAAPAASVTLLWLFTSTYEIVVGRYVLNDVIPVLPIILGGGILGGLIVELIFVTPLLFAFRRFRWPWLNGWWIAGYGLVVGEIVYVLLMPFEPHHWFGWGAVTQGTVVCGFVGMIAAIVFSLIAFRRLEVSQPSE